MAPAQQVRPVRLCCQCGRASHVPSGSHQNPTTDPRRGGCETVRRRRCGGGGGPYRGMVRTAIGIVQEEGVLKLWQGATPAVYRHVVYSGVRMVVYEQLRDSPLGKGTSDTLPAVVGGRIFTLFCASVFLSLVYDMGRMG
ncbi:unnamed protein product [Ranitomeya imitator]|uniref:ADP/ATP translocase n=1 Tax=Ranitomeya imitator TaxID=111125 RepID=A0ABN9M6X1_9NEOB|nr:unnamed protein product [Ranitomeya imitator]